MGYRVELSPAANRQFRKLPGKAKVRLATRIDGLSADPRPPDAKRLAGGGRTLWRVGESDYPIVHEVLDDVLRVWVLKVGHRKEVYERLRNLR